MKLRSCSGKGMRKKQVVHYLGNQLELLANFPHLNSTQPGPVMTEAAFLFSLAVIPFSFSSIIMTST